MHKHLQKAEKLALEHEFDEGLEYFLCAILVKGGKILSTGFNKKATNAFVEHFADRARGQRDYCMSTHAEQDAVLRARGKIDLRGAKVFVVRIKVSGGLGMARPCSICYGVLQSYGIGRAYYSIDDQYCGILQIDEHPMEKKMDKIIATHPRKET